MRTERFTADPSCDQGSGVHLDMSSFPTTNRWSLPARFRIWYHASALRLLVAEFCSLPYRMRYSLEIRAWERQGRTGTAPHSPSWDSIGGSQDYRRAYIVHMQQIQARYPFLSIFDLFLLGHTWRVGSEWRDRIRIARSQEGLNSSANPDGGNSMPPSGVPQPTKHDPPKTLPLQE